MRQLGVRSDRGTAWRNPFSDLELGALLAYYVGGKSDAGGRWRSGGFPAEPD